MSFDFETKKSFKKSSAERCIHFSGLCGLLYVRGFKKKKKKKSPARRDKCWGMSIKLCCKQCHSAWCSVGGRGR